MPRSGIRQVMDAAWRVDGDVIGLHVGEPEFTPAAHIIDAAAQAYADGRTRYVPNAGIPELRSALSRKLAQRNHLSIPPEQVVVTAGGMQALYLALTMTLQQGDEALVPEPGWPNFRMAVGLQQATPVGYELRPDRGFLPDVADLERLITPRTKILLVNTPSNPLGTVMPAGIVEELVDFAARHGLWLLSDECYDGLTYNADHVSPATFDTHGVVLSAFSFSKTYAMTGVRVGYLTCPPDVAPIAANLQEALLSCVNAPAQMAAIAALEGSQDHVDQMRQAYARRRAAAMRWLEQQSLPFIEPHGAFYIWVDVSGLTDQPVVDWSLDLLARQRVAVAPGTAFGAAGEGWIRLSLAASDDEVEEGIARIGAMR